MNNQSTKDKDARSSNAMAATSHPLATEEALKILKMGGNAVDASIAASIVLSVVEPNATSIGGDCFAIVKMNNKNAVSFNGSGLTPEKLSYNFLKEKNIDKIGLTSPHSVTIPGAVHAWETIHKEFGKLEFEQLFSGAIDIAKNGHKISKVVSNAWHNSFNKINRNENSKKIFLKEGRTYQENELMKNIPLGKTLEAISKKGSKEFYEGETAKDIIESLNELGGVHTYEDFSKQNTIKSETIKSSYRDEFIHQCPPNGPGVTVLIMMKLLEKLNIQNYKFNSTERFHLEAEVTKQAYKVKETRLGDPSFVNFDLDEILSDKNIDDIFNKINLDSCSDVGDLNIPAHPETIYLTVVDKDLNSVSIINSVCYVFGSGITTNKSGILLHNRGTNFRVEHGHPNCIEGLKRPLHTIIPGMVIDKDNNATLSYGVMGGQYQPVGQVHVLNNMIDYSMGPQEALSFPRAFHFNNIFKLEKSVDNKIFNELKEIGHNVEYIDGTHGGGQAIKINRTEGDLLGGSDPRKDGYAKGY